MPSQLVVAWQAGARGQPWVQLTSGVSGSDDYRALPVYPVHHPRWMSGPVDGSGQRRRRGQENAGAASPVAGGAWHASDLMD